MLTRHGKFDKHQIWRDVHGLFDVDCHADVLSRDTEFAVYRMKEKFGE